MKKMLTALAALILLSGCGSKAAVSKISGDEIPRGTWTPREEEAEPYISDPAEATHYVYNWRENFENPGPRRKSPAERIKELPQDERALFIAEARESCWFDEEVLKQQEIYIKALNAFHEEEDKNSAQWKSAQKKAMEAYAAYNSVREPKELEIKKELAQNFIEKGYPVKIMAEEFIQMGTETKYYALVVEGKPENFLEDIKRVEGLLSVDIFDELASDRYDILIWEREP